MNSLELSSTGLLCPLINFEPSDINLEGWKTDLVIYVGRVPCVHQTFTTSLHRNNIVTSVKADFNISVIDFK